MTETRMGCDIVASRGEKNREWGKYKKKETKNARTKDKKK